MNSEKAWNMFVFRDGRKTVPGATLARDLATAIRDAYARDGGGGENPLIEALLRAGEFECALSDSGGAGADSVARLTDVLAGALVSGTRIDAPCEELLRMLPERPPAELRISPPEGFAYYALHPLDYSDMALEMPVAASAVCVIGIRSIGTTLSGLVAAGFRKRGVRTERITVRPTGHPYERRSRFGAAETVLICDLKERGAEFVVVDEGPGMSGSSFLSVGDALVEMGIDREKIAFLCSRVPDPDSLRATNGGPRWRSYRCFYARKNSRLPAGADIYVGGGEWRKFLLRAAAEWPESWTQMERLKFLSEDRQWLLKFEGFGRFGRVVNERMEQVAEAGFGPAPICFSQGFSTYPVVPGRAANVWELNAGMLSRLAEYCAMRVKAFRWDGFIDAEQIETMVRFNLSEEFGSDVPFRFEGLRFERPVIADGRMMPQEWILPANGKMLKVDCGSHGDDHFFPGPTDVAWDLAGAIVEWSMDGTAAEYFVSEYVRMSGDDIRRRLPGFVMAYAVFRFAYCKMSAAVMNGTGEDRLLGAAYQRYRSMVGAMEERAATPLAA